MKPCFMYRNGGGENRLSWDERKVGCVERENTANSVHARVRIESILLARVKETPRYQVVFQKTVSRVISGILVPLWKYHRDRGD